MTTRVTYCAGRKKFGSIEPDAERNKRVLIGRDNISGYRSRTCLIRTGKSVLLNRRVNFTRLFVPCVLFALCVSCVLTQSCRGAGRGNNICLLISRRRREKSRSSPRDFRRFFPTSPLHNFRVHRTHAIYARDISRSPFAILARYRSLRVIYDSY